VNDSVKDIVKLNRRNRNLGRYILIMLGLGILCVFVCLMLSWLLFHYFLWENHTSLPYMFQVGVLFNSAFLCITFSISTIVTGLLIRKGKKNITVLIVMTGFMLGYNLLPWFGYYSETRMDFVLSLKVHIIYVAAPTLLFLLLQLIVYVLLFGERTTDKQIT